MRAFVRCVCWLVLEGYEHGILCVIIGLCVRKRILFYGVWWPLSF